MAERADVIIAWSHGGIPKSVQPEFQRPTRFITVPSPEKWSQTLAGLLPSPIRGIVAKYAPGVEPLRVAVLGFSASCSGVVQMLASSDGGRIDSALAIDGIHAGYDAQKKPNAASMKTWVEFAKLAFLNERLFVITHSSVVPPNYASTTETANYIWNALGESSDFADPPLPDLSVAPTSVHVAAGPATGPDRTVQYPAPPWKTQRRRGGLVILGCNNNDVPRGTADHIYQAKAMLPLALVRFLAARWNNMDPNAPGASCYVG